ncbi:hypothetical protein D0C36_17065 [Mucilaginibacter conchicola]|uniref:Uncharacterized protein n=1 Tax=Mucilaginibacter conchicola TaxID=2303333 RepID=A0A372NP13_9SPHI|nr:hypothetical protein [Mucilaginibacter conchicola]RFZ90674.1 hypothetical protein D0C36_17065 [Mucilaginibacter conchicola]
MDPVAYYKPVKEAPVAPEGMKVVERSNSWRTLDDKTPVIVFRGLTYWVFAFKDNRFSYGVGAYDDTGHLVCEWQRHEDVRYVRDILIDPANRTFTFVGNNGKGDTVTWDLFILD